MLDLNAIEEVLDCGQYSASDLAGIVEAFISEVKALRAEREWRPISTAPRDGTEVLLLMPLRWQSYESDQDERIGKGDYIKTAWWTGNVWKDRLNNYVLADSPTHWTYLPQPPKVEG